MSMLLAGGAVFTGHARAPWTEAVLLDGDRIVAAGEYRDLRERAPAADVVDVAGGTVLPGLIDAHNHALASGEAMANLDLRGSGITTTPELMAAIESRSPSGSGVVSSTPARRSTTELTSAPCPDP